MRLHVSIKGLQLRILIYLAWAWYSTYQWENRKENLACKKSVQVCEIWRYIYRLLNKTILTYGLVSSYGKSQWVGKLGFNSRRMPKLSAPTWPFCMARAQSQSVDWHVRFVLLRSLCLLSRISSLAISRWHSFTVLSLNIHIWLPCFGALGVLPLAQTRPCVHMLRSQEQK